MNQKLERADSTEPGELSKVTDVADRIKKALCKDRTESTDIFGDKDINAAITQRLEEEIRSTFSGLEAMSQQDIMEIMETVRAVEVPVPQDLVSQKPVKPEEVSGKDLRAKATEDCVAYGDQVLTAWKARSQYKSALLEFLNRIDEDNAYKDNVRTIVYTMLDRLDKVSDLLYKDYITFQQYRFVYHRPEVPKTGFDPVKPILTLKDQIKKEEERAHNKTLFDDFMRDLQRDDCVLSKRVFWDKRDYAKQILVELIDRQGKENAPQEEIQTLWQWFLDLIFPLGKQMRDKYRQLNLDVDKYKAVWVALGRTQTEALGYMDDQDPYEKVKVWRSSLRK